MSIVVHELRGPVHAIQNLLSVVLGGRLGELTSLQREFLDTALVSTRRLGRLADDLHASLFPERGRPLDIRPTDLLKSVETATRELSHVSTRFVIDAPATESWELSTDPVRLSQVVFNLLENAAHYAATGTDVVVRLRQSDAEFRCSIENRVDGLPDQDVTHWFEYFWRGDAAQSARPHGLGLGLPIVNHIVTRLGGRPWVSLHDSLVSIGFTLPKAPDVN